MKVNPFKLISQLQVLLVMILIAGLGVNFIPEYWVKASTTITVTTTADTVSTDGYCSLREAIIAANKDIASSPQAGECKAGSGSDTIVLPAGTFTLTKTDNGKEDAAATGDLDILGDVIIQGAGPDKTIITDIPNFTDRIFQVWKGKVTFSGVTISMGNPSGDGAAIYNVSSLALNNVVLTSNKAGGRGAGIYNSSTGSLSISSSTIYSNTATGNGGGILNDGGILTVTNSTISGNYTNLSGGGIYNGGTASINNVTIARNTADANKDGTGDGGGVFQNAGAFNLSNSLIAGDFDLSPTGKPQILDCAGNLTSQGYNLVQNLTGCTLGGVSTGNIIGVDPRLDTTLTVNAPNPPVTASNYYPVPTIALLPSSPAVDKGNPAATGSAPNCVPTDARGVTRPQGAACDIGAFELQDPLQPGPIFTVNTAGDPTDGACRVSTCSLRQAMIAANNRVNDSSSSPDQIVFNINATGVQTIQPISALPAITDSVNISGTSKTNGSIVLSGTSAGSGVDGLTISSGGTTVKGLTIQGFKGNGVSLKTNGKDLIVGNTIQNNGANGVVVTSGAGDTISQNLISGNAGLGIDLGGDGVTLNGTKSPPGPNNWQNFPVLITAVPGSSSTTFQGRVNGAPNTSYTIEFYSNTVCSPQGYGQGQTYLGSAQVTTDSKGYFTQTLPAVVSLNQFLSATATNSNGDTSEFSACLVASPDNTSWPKAFPVVAGNASYSVDQYLDKPGEVRWYKFPVQPGSKVIITLTKLPANYDLALYKDIGAAFTSLNSTADLARLSAEFAPDSFSPDSFSPDSFSPDSFSPDSFSPDSFSPDSFSPDSFSPDAYTPDSFSPDSFSPDSFSPDSFSPDSFSPDSFSPDSFSPDSFSPVSFSNAQSRSLIAVSAFDGTASEGIIANTWENNSFFYVRVRGRNSAYSLDTPFHLTITQLSSNCSSISSAGFPASNMNASAGNYQTIILTDMGRLGGTVTDTNTLQSKLAAFAARPEVAGVIVPVGNDARVAAANTMADANPACPNAKNLVAYSIKDIVNKYAAVNPLLQYVVIIGNDNVVPFFRQPDQSDLAPESNFVPPVKDSSASQASLKLNYVLSQDRYGSKVELSSKTNSFPIPNMAVGRLVNNAAEISGMLDAYMTTTGGVLPVPTSAMVTGYDFLANGANAVLSNLQMGLGTTGKVDTLITPRDVAPTSPSAWTATDLSSMLLGSRHDLIFLAGHFSASTALAADYTTRVFAKDVAASQIDLTNALIFSAGCHSAYNLVPGDVIPNVTQLPDWAETFAIKKATLIAGTGYQYGDTDFVKYSEQLYVIFSNQLLAGSGPVSIGKALVAAKQTYLASTPVMSGIDQKAVLEATLYGLPMLSVNMPAGRFNPSSKPSIVTSLSPFGANPGKTLGLSFSDVTVNPTLTRNDVIVKDPNNNSTSTATYLSAGDGTVSMPGAPILPLDIRNVNAPTTTPPVVLRGVGFRGGSFTELSGILPLTGATATEIRGVHSPFFSDFLFPVQLWNINYFAALTNSANGNTSLMLTPAQYISDSPLSQTGTMREFTSMNFRLYYSGNYTTTLIAGNTPALAAAPTIERVTSSVANGNVIANVQVVGDLSAGIQEVWVTYLIPGSGTWTSVNLTQSTTDTTQWSGAIPVGTANPGDIRFMVQAANGVGLVAMSTNMGAYYIPGVNKPPSTPTTLTLSSQNPTTGPYNTNTTLKAVLTSNGTPLSGKRIALGLGSQTRQALTNSTGTATVIMPLLSLTGNNLVRAAFAGDTQYVASSDQSSFNITKQATQLILMTSTGTVTNTAAVQYSDSANLVAVLKDATGMPIREATVFFVVGSGTNSYAVPVITDYAGRAPLGNIYLQPGSYPVNVYFSGQIPLPGTTINLDDYRYTSSTTAGTLNVTSEDASVNYTGDISILAGAPVHMAAKVTQTPPDGSLGDITLAQVQFTLQDSTGKTISTTVASVAPDGSASATYNGVLSSAMYQIQSSVVGSYFTSQVVNTALNVAVRTSTLTYTGDTVIPAGAPLHLSATVTPVQSGSTLDITLAQVEFDVLDSTGNKAFTTIVNVASNGTATATANGLPSGVYLVNSTVVGVYYTSPTVTTLVAVYNVLGQVTGSASINSPAGAYPSQPSLTGSTSFGFNAQYQSGATIPTGQTQFQFQAANLNFHSSSYDWLAVNGVWAQWQGSGTNNGSGNYGFFISLIDGQAANPAGPHLFRIKIWDKTNGVILYDSQIGDPDNAYPTTPLSKGQITVH